MKYVVVHPFADHKKGDVLAAKPVGIENIDNLVVGVADAAHVASAVVPPSSIAEAKSVIDGVLESLSPKS